MERRKFLNLVLASTAVGGTAALVGCSEGSPSGGQGDGDGGGTLVVYSNSVSDGRGEWLKEQAAAVGFTIEFVDLGGGDIQDRLLAESANPIADVVFGLNDIYFERLKANSVLEPYAPSWSELLGESVGDGESYWPIVREPIMLVYSTQAYPTPEQAPRDWPDLWTDAAFHNRYEVPQGLGGATTQVVVSGILSRYLDAAGDLGVSQEGWDAIEQFFANGSPATQGVDLYARMASGEVDMGQMWLAGKAAREAEYGIATEPVRPTIGVPMATQHVAVVAGSKRAEQAQQFVDWFGGAEMQASWSNEFFTAPTNTDALTSADPDAVALTESFTPQDIDWRTVSTQLPDWVEKIELEYLG